MSNMQEKPEISNAEFEVLDVLWDDHPATSNDVVVRLNDKKDWHEKTVKTLLGRLVKKGVLGFDSNANISTTRSLRARIIQRKKRQTSLVAYLRAKLPQWSPVLPIKTRFLNKM